MTKTPLLYILLFAVIILWPASAYSLTSQETALLTGRLAHSIIAAADPHSGIAPSFYGYPGFETLTFTYDAAVMAMVLKAAGKQAEAEKALDYFTQKLHIPLNEIMNNGNMQKTYGMLRLFGSDDDLGLLNAFDRTSAKPQGQGQLEYLVTPGPIAFIIMALLQVNKEKYLDDALDLGETLLAMQRPDGAVSDGDRNAANVHTEPHDDAMNVFYQLFQLTGDAKWKTAADKAAQWFMDNVYSQDGTIDQGIRPAGPSTIFATDAYSWTMAGKLGDRIPLDVLERMTDRMLSKSLVRISVELPDGRTQTAMSIDFTDAQSASAIEARKGVHPMGSPEWTGGVILALQKNAVRFYNVGDLAKAQYFKAMAEIMTDEWAKMSYDVDGLTMFSYSSGQGLATGHGWNTPYFYVKGPEGVSIKGGSLIGSWAVLPINGINPLVLGDNYFEVYQHIHITTVDQQKASGYLQGLAAARSFQESAVTQAPDPREQMVEPGNYNKQAWAGFAKQDYKEAILWAQKVVNEPEWVRMAREEQKAKARDVGGLVAYPWGTTFDNNDNAVHTQIWKYPMLNEVGTAMWLLAASNYELGNADEAKMWMKRIVVEVPYHQIPDVIYDQRTGKMDLIDGYWNALTSWTQNPGNSIRDAGMGELVKAQGLNVLTPQMVALPAVRPVTAGFVVAQANAFQYNAPQVRTLPSIDR